MATGSCSGDRGPQRNARLRLVTNTPNAAGSKVLGRLISQKQLRNSVVYNMLKSAWARYGPVKMKELDERTTVFEFESEKDKKIDHGPVSLVYSRPLSEFKGVP